MDYKEIAEILCDGFMDMPSGCEGCPLYYEESGCPLKNNAENIIGRDYAEKTGKCPICIDCPKNCPLDKN